MTSCCELQPRDRLLVAVDVKSASEALGLIEELQGEVGGFKLGLELFTQTLVQLGTLYEAKALEVLGAWRRLFSSVGAGKIAWDNKFDDISNTVGAAAAALGPIAPLWFNVHASAGIDAMMGAVAKKGNSKVAAVTVLTSLDAANAELIFGASVQAKVLQFARDAKLAGVDAIICSPADLPFLVARPELAGLEYHTPGVRPAGTDKGDQARVATPGGAIKAGATRVIVGRPVTKPASGTRVEAVRAIVAEIEQAEAEMAAEAAKK